MSLWWVLIAQWQCFGSGNVHLLYTFSMEHFYVLKNKSTLYFVTQDLITGYLYLHLIGKSLQIIIDLFCFVCESSFVLSKYLLCAEKRHVLKGGVEWSGVVEYWSAWVFEWCHGVKTFSYEKKCGGVLGSIVFKLN